MGFFGVDHRSIILFVIGFDEFWILRLVMMLGLKQVCERPYWHVVLFHINCVPRDLGCLYRVKELK